MVLSECYEMSVEELEEDIMVTHEAMYGSIAILTCAFLKIVTRDRLNGCTLNWPLNNFDTHLPTLLMGNKKRLIYNLHYIVRLDFKILLWAHKDRLLDWETDFKTKLNK